MYVYMYARVSSFLYYVIIQKRVNLKVWMSRKVLVNQSLCTIISERVHVTEDVERFHVLRFRVERDEFSKPNRIFIGTARTSGIAAGGRVPLQDCLHHRLAHVRLRRAGHLLRGGSSSLVQPVSHAHWQHKHHLPRGGSLQQGRFASVWWWVRRSCSGRTVRCLSTAMPRNQSSNRNGEYACSQ